MPRDSRLDSPPTRSSSTRMGGGSGRDAIRSTLRQSVWERTDLQDLGEVQAVRFLAPDVASVAGQFQLQDEEGAALSSGPLQPHRRSEGRPVATGRAATGPPRLQRRRLRTRTDRCGSSNGWSAIGSTRERMARLRPRFAGMRIRSSWFASTRSSSVTNLSSSGTQWIGWGPPSPANPLLEL